MPDVQEVFRMATQKVRQDPGALDRQVAKQGRVVRNRRLSAFAMVLVLVAAAVAAYALTRGGSQDVPANGSVISIGAGAGPGTMIDLRTGDVTPLPASIATAGIYYAAVPRPDDGRLQHVLQPAGAALHGERRRDAGAPDLRDRRGRLRRTVVPGRLDARVSATGRLDPAPGEPGRPRSCNGPTHATHALRGTALGLVVHVPELRAGRSVDPVPAPERRPQQPDLGPLVRTGRRRGADPRSTQRRVGRLLAGRHVGSPISHRSTRTTSPEEGSGSRASTGEHPEPWSPKGISSG